MRLRRWSTSQEMKVVQIQVVQIEVVGIPVVEVVVQVVE
jgi:hypothetical protein